MEALGEYNTRQLIAANLKHLLEINHMTRMEACEALDVRYTTLCDWLNAKTYPRIEALEKISDYFGIQVGDFFIDCENPNKYPEDRLMNYAIRMSEIPIEMISNMSDKQIKALLQAGVRIKRKTLEEYIADAGQTKMIAAPELDWGKPVGDEIW